MKKIFLMLTSFFHAVIESFGFFHAVIESPASIVVRYRANRRAHDCQMVKALNANPSNTFR